METRHVGVVTDRSWHEAGAIGRCIDIDVMTGERRIYTDEVPMAEWEVIERDIGNCYGRRI